MNQHPGIVIERMDDIPLLLAVMEQLELPETLDRHLGNHGHQQGVSKGWVATIWLAFILSEGKHTKMHVQEWVENRWHLLNELSGQRLRLEDFNDDRLTLVLRRLSDLTKWHGIESVTDRPTGQRILRAFVRAELTRVGMVMGGQRLWQLTPLPPLLIQILALLGVPNHVYFQLGNSP